ncbi:MAG: hypothetical protein JSR34_03875 [Proteobacteria bacterium]|nr:hypothetical protein [Pseudomonadota bacterium]
MPSLAVRAGIGDDFGSRDPAVCLLRYDPAKGALSQAQANRYFLCDTEKVGDLGATMVLVNELRLSVDAKGRALDPKTDTYALHADPTLPVYPINGDFRLYQCGRKTSAEGMANPGHACHYEEYFRRTGLCWKNLGGEWHCAIPYHVKPTRSVHSVAPPRAGDYLATGADPFAQPGGRSTPAKPTKRGKVHR